jgi:cytochrome bd-type quinol oxidase subunit 2
MKTLQKREYCLYGIVLGIIISSVFYAYYLIPIDEMIAMHLTVRFTSMLLISIIITLLLAIITFFKNKNRKSLLVKILICLFLYALSKFAYFGGDVLGG